MYHNNRIPASVHTQVNLNNSSLIHQMQAVRGGRWGRGGEVSCERWGRGGGTSLVSMTVLPCLYPRNVSVVHVCVWGGGGGGGEGSE